MGLNLLTPSHKMVSANSEKIIKRESFCPNLKLIHWKIIYMLV